MADTNGNENASRLDQSRQLVKQATAGRADDRHPVLGGIPLLVALHAITRREQRIDVFLGFWLYDAIHPQSLRGIALLQGLVGQPGSGVIRASLSVPRFTRDHIGRSNDTASAEENNPVKWHFGSGPVARTARNEE